MAHGGDVSDLEIFAYQNILAIHKQSSSLQLVGYRAGKSSHLSGPNAARGVVLAALWRKQMPWKKRIESDYSL